MFRGPFFGHNPSHFHINPLVKAYMISESFMWSAWNFILPIFAIFITQEIEGGNVQTAAAGYSTYLISRVVFELITGQYLRSSHDKKKILVVLVGMILLGFSYIGFAFSTSIPILFGFYFLSGMGIGLSSPAKNALFSMHLDKNKEATEWSISDAFQFFSMALASALGGFIALEYGFKLLFYFAFILNFIAMIPFLLLVNIRRLMR